MIAMITIVASAMLPTRSPAAILLYKHKKLLLRSFLRLDYERDLLRDKAISVYFLCYRVVKQKGWHTSCQVWWQIWSVTPGDNETTYKKNSRIEIVRFEKSVTTKTKPEFNFVIFGGRDPDAELWMG
jgi:hypothetical protein